MCSKNPANETFCRTSDGWVVGRKANERELFLHDEHKNHSLTEVDGGCIGWFRRNILLLLWELLGSCNSV